MDFWSIAEKVGVAAIAFDAALCTVSAVLSAIDGDYKYALGKGFCATGDAIILHEIYKISH